MSDDIRARDALRQMWANGGRKVLVAALAAIAALGLLASVIVWRTATTPDTPWEPFVYPVLPQHVLGPLVDVRDGSTTVQAVIVDYDGTARPEFEVTGSKCNNAAGAVDKRVERTWRTINPIGTVIGDPGSGAVTSTPPGCVSRTDQNPWRNPIPDAVLGRVTELAHNGMTVTLWQFQGVDTPLGPPPGQFGVAARWQTETFAIRYTGG